MLSFLSQCLRRESLCQLSPALLSGELIKQALGVAWWMRITQVKKDIVLRRGVLLTSSPSGALPDFQMSDDSCAGLTL